MKIAPIDIGTAANKILKWKQECYHENGLLFLILFSVCFSILFAFLFTLLKHLAKEYINSLEKDTCTFAISFSVIVQLLLERYTHVIETVSAITCPTTTTVIPLVFAIYMSKLQHSRICETLPGVEVIFCV